MDQICYVVWGMIAIYQYHLDPHRNTHTRLYEDEDDGDNLVQATRKLSRWEFAGWWGGEVQGLVMHKSASIRQFLRNLKIFSTMGLTQESSNRFIQHNQFWPNLNFFSDVRWRCKTWRRLCYLIWLKQSTPGSVVPCIKCLCCGFT